MDNPFAPGRRGRFLLAPSEAARAPWAAAVRAGGVELVDGGAVVGVAPGTGQRQGPSLPVLWPDARAGGPIRAIFQLQDALPQDLDMDWGWTFEFPHAPAQPNILVLDLRWHLPAGAYRSLQCWTDVRRHAGVLDLVYQERTLALLPGPTAPSAVFTREAAGLVLTFPRRPGLGEDEWALWRDWTHLWLAGQDPGRTLGGRLAGLAAALAARGARN